VGNALKDQYEDMIRESDAIITPSVVLSKKIKKYFKKPVFICPNGINYEIYKDRLEFRRDEKPFITVGYMGAASHWKDLQIVVDALEELSRKYDFFFTIYGLTGEPLEAAFYAYNKMLAGNYKPEQNDYFREALEFASRLENLKMLHVPFMPPELHPSVLARADIDIGVAPLLDTEFNHGKSCIKFYEYASTGTVCLASDVEPYKSEVNYRAKNTTKDWYNKLEKLITDPEFREKIRKEQAKWVQENRSIEAIGLDWELACQKPSKGPTVLSQVKKKLKLK
jgi:glycosyltransferase involved in cell wall biosynthesis